MDLENSGCLVRKGNNVLLFQPVKARKGFQNIFYRICGQVSWLGCQTLLCFVSDPKCNDIFSNFIPLKIRNASAIPGRQICILFSPTKWRWRLLG